MWHFQWEEHLVWDWRSHFVFLPIKMLQCDEGSFLGFSYRDDSACIETRVFCVTAEPHCSARPAAGYGNISPDSDALLSLPANFDGHWWWDTASGVLRECTAAGVHGEWGIKAPGLFFIVFFWCWIKKILSFSSVTIPPNRKVLGLVKCCQSCLCNLYEETDVIQGFHWVWLCIVCSSGASSKKYFLHIASVSSSSQLCHDAAELNF